MITDKEVELIIKIFKRVVPYLVLSVQIYSKDVEDRTGYLIGKTKYKQFEFLYINIQNITPWQIKTFEIMTKKYLPNRAIIKTKDEITRLIFK